MQPLIARGSRQNSTSASVTTPPSTPSVGPVVAYPEVVPLGQVAAPVPAPPPRAKVARRSGIGPKPAKPVGITELPERRSRRDIITITQLKFCKEVLDYIYRPEFETWAYPFMSPVGTLSPPFTSSSLVGTILEDCPPTIETHELN